MRYLVTGTAGDMARTFGSQAIILAENRDPFDALYRDLRRTHVLGDQAILEQFSETLLPGLLALEKQISELEKQLGDMRLSELEKQLMDKQLSELEKQLVDMRLSELADQFVDKQLSELAEQLVDNQLSNLKKELGDNQLLEFKPQVLELKKQLLKTQVLEIQLLDKQLLKKQLLDKQYCQGNWDARSVLQYLFTSYYFCPLATDEELFSLESGCGLLKMSDYPRKMPFEKIELLLQHKNVVILYNDSLFHVNKINRTVNQIKLTDNNRARYNWLKLKFIDDYNVANKNELAVISFITGSLLDGLGSATANSFLFGFSYFDDEGVLSGFAIHVRKDDPSIFSMALVKNVNQGPEARDQYLYTSLDVNRVFDVIKRDPETRSLGILPEALPEGMVTVIDEKAAPEQFLEQIKSKNVRQLFDYFITITRGKSTADIAKQLNWIEYFLLSFVPTAGGFVENGAFINKVFENNFKGFFNNKALALLLEYRITLPQEQLIACLDKKSATYKEIIGFKSKSDDTDIATQLAFFLLLRQNGMTKSQAESSVKTMCLLNRFVPSVIDNNNDNRINIPPVWQEIFKSNDAFSCLAFWSKWGNDFSAIARALVSEPLTRMNKDRFNAMKTRLSRIEWDFPKDAFLLTTASLLLIKVPELAERGRGLEWQGLVKTMRMHPSVFKGYKTPTDLVNFLTSENNGSYQGVVEKIKELGQVFRKKKLFSELDDLDDLELSEGKALLTEQADIDQLVKIERLCHTIRKEFRSHLGEKYGVSPDECEASLKKNGRYYDSKTSGFLLEKKAFYQKEKAYKIAIYKAYFKALSSKEPDKINQLKVDIKGAEAIFDEIINVQENLWIKRPLALIANALILIFTAGAANRHHKQKTGDFWFFTRTDLSQRIHTLDLELSSNIASVDNGKSGQKLG